MYVNMVMYTTIGYLGTGVWKNCGFYLKGSSTPLKNWLVAFTIKALKNIYTKYESQ